MVTKLPPIEGSMSRLEAMEFWKLLNDLHFGSLKSALSTLNNLLRTTLICWGAAILFWVLIGKTSPDANGIEATLSHPMLWIALMFSATCGFCLFGSRDILHSIIEAGRYQKCGVQIEQQYELPSRIFSTQRSMGAGDPIPVMVAFTLVCLLSGLPGPVALTIALWPLLSGYAAVVGSTLLLGILAGIALSAMRFRKARRQEN